MSTSITTIEHETALAPNPLYVLEFAPPSAEYDWIYATVGVSRITLPAPTLDRHGHPEFRIELFLNTRERQPELPTSLAALALYPFHHKTFLAPGHTIPGNEGLVPESPVTDLLFLRPDIDLPEFEIIHHSDGSHTQLVWVIPLYPSERQFVKQYGWEALVDLFYRYQLDTSDLKRRPVAQKVGKLSYNQGKNDVTARLLRLGITRGRRCALSKSNWGSGMGVPLLSLEPSQRMTSDVGGRCAAGGFTSYPLDTDDAKSAESRVAESCGNSSTPLLCAC